MKHEVEETKLKAIFASSPDAITVSDLNGNITDCNKAALDMFGFSSIEELIGKSGFEWIAKKDHQRAMEDLKKILEQGSVKNIQYRCLTKDGHEFPAELSASVIKDPSGNPTGFVAITKDITERKQVEEELRKSEMRYRSLVEDTGAGIAIADSEGRFTFVNKALCKTIGYSEKELIGKPFADFLHPDDKEKILQIFWESWRYPNRRLPLDFRVIHKKGHIVHMYSSPTILKYKNEIVGFNAIIHDITERKKAEDALRKSESKARTLLENLPQKIFFKDKNSVYISCNENYARDLKIHPDEISDKTDYDFYPKRLAEKYRADDQRIMKSRKAEDIEEEYIQDGHKVFVHTVKTPVKDENGNVVGILGIFWDITERKKAEEELSRLSSAVKMSTDSIVISDLDGKIIDVNEATLKMYGTDDKRNLIGTNSFDLIDPEEQEKALAGAKDVLEKGYLKGREYHIVTKDGGRIPVEMSVAIMKDADGKPIGFVGISRDITERKEMEEKLKHYSEHLEELVQKRTDELLESEKRYSVLVEEARDGVVILQDKKLVFTNKRLAEIIGYSRYELIGMPIEKLVDEKYRQQAKERHMRRMQGEKVLAIYEIELVAKTGERVPVEINATRINYQGRPASLIIMRDTIERKRMEEQRLKLENLATMGELATMVGHDLRNPLQSIENATYYLNNELQHLSIPQKATEMLQIINNSVNYADKIVKDLHDFSTTKKPAFKKTNINNIVKEILSQVETPENVELVTKLGHLPKIKVDEDMIKRTFLNLAINGIQAMEKRGTLKVSTKKTKGFVEVSFTDTGIGMPKENMKKIGTLFFTTRAKGMGMGLPICKKFVEIHGGSIEVESEEGKGSTFTVKLPIQQEESGGEKP